MPIQLAMVGLVVSDIGRAPCRDRGGPDGNPVLITAVDPGADI